MKVMLLSSAIIMALAATPSLAAQKSGFVTVTYNSKRVSVPIGIASQVCGHSASYIAKHRDSFRCTVRSTTQNKAFLNLIKRNS